MVGTALLCAAGKAVRLDRAFAHSTDLSQADEKTKWSAAALPRSKATLQQGLPLRAERSAAGQFWTFTMSNSKALVGYA